MDEVIAVSEPDGPPEPRLPPKGHPLVAWLVIILITGFLVVFQSLRSEKRAADTEDRAGLLTMQLQARSIVGVAHLLSAPSSGTQVQSLNTGPVARRLRAIILEGELAGPEQAEELL